MKLTILGMVLCALAYVILTSPRWKPRPAPAPRVAVADSLAPIAVKIGDRVYIQGRVRAVIPHGKGVMVEIVPTKAAK